jgi:hypothetical protein
MTANIHPPFGPSFVPLPYRQVSVQSYDGAMTEAAIVAHLRGRDSYRRTRFVVLRQGDTCAIAWVDRASEGPLFSPITDVAVLALPDTCILAEDEMVDTANPSALAAAALQRGVGERATLVVYGMDAHVNFIYHPKPMTIRVVDVVPPEPPKLLRMARHVLTFAELPAIQLDPQIIDLRDLARQAPDAEAFLVPCRASGMDFAAPTYFLDERPARRDWTMLACERSCQIHRHFYGEAEAPRIDFCPRNHVPANGIPTLLKCCLLEDRIEVDEQMVVVPWGATLQQIQAALQLLAGVEQPIAGGVSASSGCE